MAYNKPNLYSINKQEMLNNAPSPSCINNLSLPECGVTSCYVNAIPEQTCGTDSTGTCGILDVCGPNSNPTCSANSAGTGCGNTSNPSCRPTGLSCSPTSTSHCTGGIYKPLGSSSNYTTKPTYLSSTLIENETDDHYISIIIDPYTNDIKITAGGLYPVEKLAELCKELYI